jgi:ATP-dependent Lon protease
MIIPTGNLLGDEGIERLPEALKQEIQILNYGDWKRDHPPFDYERHMLQVVAVDHITEAADIAFMDQKELDALRDRFVPHARSVAGMLRTDRKGTDGFCSVFYPKAPKELEAEICDASFWGSCRPCLVVGPEMKKDLLECFQGLDRQVQIWEYSPSTDKLSNIVEKIRKTLSKDSASPAQITLVAPFYFLMRSDLRAEELPSFSDSNGLRLFANNYAAQHIKMKGCRAVLNRVFCYLSQLKSTDIESCPFLTKLKGIYTVDLSFIPEKYRLDVQRSERILNGCLNQWLEEVEKAHKKDNT